MAVHELDYWLCLLDVFQTDEQAATKSPTPRPAAGCLEGRDSCPAPGFDPIHNHMNHNDDRCRTHFTAGQAERMGGAQLRGPRVS
ncbi:hypothetical protein [Streptomyces sp. NPDC058548]|uniref:hypothetical protein n=1 Tax=Streptomyces sp. NPDC058548 TaxID=3346545 RepID=UPI0036672177